MRNLHLMKNLPLSWRWNTKSLAEVYATEVVYFYTVHLANSKNKNSANCISRTKKEQQQQQKKKITSRQRPVFSSLYYYSGTKIAIVMSLWFLLKVSDLGRFILQGNLEEKKIINERTLTLLSPYLLDKNWFHV